jgi:hypothetical protein
MCFTKSLSTISLYIVVSSWADTAYFPWARQSIVVRLSWRIWRGRISRTNSVLSMIYSHAYCLVKTVRCSDMVDETKRWFTQLLHLVTRWTVHAYLIAKAIDRGCAENAVDALRRVHVSQYLIDGNFNRFCPSAVNHALTIHEPSSQ